MVVVKTAKQKEEFTLSYCAQGRLFTFEDFCDEHDDNSRLVLVLSALEPYLEPVVKKLEFERAGRRDHYPVQVMMNCFIAGYVYQIPVKNELIRELRRNGSLRRLVGIESIAKVPKSWQFSRFLGSLSSDENLALLEQGFDRCVEGLRLLIPGFGHNLGIDGTAVKSWSSGVKDEKTGVASDVEAAWGIREKRRKKDGKIEKVVKKWFGYLVTLVVDVDSELPVGFDVSPANESEMTKLPEIFDKVVDKHPELEIKTVIADAGYDSAENCSYVLDKLDALPVIKMRLYEGPDAECQSSVCRCTELGVPICDEGTKMHYAGRDGDYLKWRCPAVVEGRACSCCITDNCSTSEYGRVLKTKIADDPRRFPGLSRDSLKWKRLYRKRSACERVNGRLKNYLLLDAQRVRGKAKVTIQVVMSILVMLASAISMARLDKLEDVRRIVALAA